jgi:uncharacterized protein (TIGR03435 family)
MKKLAVWIVAAAALPGGALFAQDLSGTWQGTLALKTELRLVVKIAKADATGMKAAFYSIDQGGQPIATSVTVQSPMVKILVPSIGGTYEGKLDGDAINLTGTWKQGEGSAIPLNLAHVAADKAWPIPEAPVRPKAMAADANPVFEVTVVKPTKPDVQGKGFRVAGREFSTINTSVNDMITFAYGLHARQITGGPSWMDTEKYDVTGKPEGEGQPNGNQWKIMVQKMLADRFQLTFHHDKKELSVYAIVVGKNGPKLTKSAGDPNGLPRLMFGRLGYLPALNASMSEFAGVMQAAVLDRPVVDQTGLTGKFDFELKWTPDETQFGAMGVKVPPAPDDPNAPPDLFTAMQDQLGLKLQATKTPADVIVIDRVAKPSEN